MLFRACLLLTMVMLSACAGGEAAPRREAAPVFDDASLVRMAQRAEVQGDRATAAVLYQRAAAQNPKDPAALRGAALTTFERGAFTAALAYAERWLELAPADPEALLLSGRILSRMKQPEAALARLDEAANAVAPQSDVELERGLALDVLGRTDEAQAAYARAITAAPADRTAPQKLALSLAISEDYRAAIQLLQRFANEPAGSSGDVRQTLAWVYALSGQADAAIEIASTSIGAGMAQAMRPVYTRISKLDAGEKAMIVHFNQVPDGLMAAAPVTDAPGVEAEPFEPPVATSDIPPSSQPSIRDVRTTPAPSLPPDPAQPAAQPPEPPLAPSHTDAGAGPYFVQIASVSEPEGLNETWARLKRQSAQLGAFTPLQQSATVGDEVRYRLLVGGFSGVSEARALVDALGADGVSALAVRVDEPGTVGGLSRP